MAKTNTIRSNSLQTNSVRLNGVEGLRRVSLSAGEIPDIPPTYTLSASVTNGKVSAKRNGSAVTLPFTANEGDTIIVEVTPNDGYAFEGWADGNTDNPRTITMNEDITLNASCKEVFVPLPTYTLSASVVNGVISATLNGKAISLPYEANEGDVIVVSVEPNEGFSFDGWADGVTDNPRTITMNADVVLSAQCVEVVQPPVGNYIQFEDKAVEAICVANWSSDGIGLTEEDAAKVTDIGATFRGNTEITSLNEFEYFTGVTFLGTSTNQTSGGAFNGCTSLQSIKLPSSVTHLRPGAFYNCTSLRSVGDLSNVKKIDIYAFAGTPLEGEINLASVEGEIGYGSFTKTNITKIVSLGNATIIGGSTQPHTGAFAECDLLQSVELTSTLTEIRNWAFYNCTSLRSVGDLSNVKKIDIYAFAGTPLEGEINLASVEGEIGYGSFTKTNITKIVSLGNATIIGGSTQPHTGAFAECDLLQSVELTSTLTEIRNWAFYKCTSLDSVICRASTPPTLGNTNAFNNTNNCPIYVPDASLEAYRTATNWNQYADRIHPLSEIEGDNGVIKYDGLVGAYTFKGRSNEDADYDLVQDRSGNGNIMTIYWG